MKVLIITDLHADNYTQFARLLDSGVNSRLQACLDVLDQVNSICQSKEITDIFFLGDLFNSRTAVPIDVYYLVEEALLKEIVSLLGTIKFCLVVIEVLACAAFLIWLGVLIRKK